MPRPVHAKKDEALAEDFKAHLYERLAALGVPSGARVRVWAADEARYGLHDRLRRCWSLRGRRAVKRMQMDYEWGYVFGAVDVIGGDSEFLLMPSVNLGFSLIFLRQIAEREPLVLSGANIYTGETELPDGGSGYLQINPKASLGTGWLRFNKRGDNTGTLVVNVPGNNVFNNCFGSFPSSQTYPHIQNLQGTNTFKGNVSISMSGGFGAVFEAETNSMLILEGTIQNATLTTSGTIEANGTLNLPATTLGSGAKINMDFCNCGRRH